jgi:hypothetical protein
LRAKTSAESLERIRDANDAYEQMQVNFEVCCGVICGRIDAGVWIYPERCESWFNKVMQQVLHELGHYDGPINGDAASTAIAIKSFQVANSCGPDGVVGKQTGPPFRRAMKERLRQPA